MHDLGEGEDQDGRPARSSGLTLVGFLGGAILVAVLLGQLGGPDPSPPVALVPTLLTTPDPLVAAPPPPRPIGAESLKRCPVQLGGLSLGDARKVSSTAVERWDCDARDRPKSLVIRATGGHFGVRSAVVTFPIDRDGFGTPLGRPQGALWDPGSRTLVWPIAGTHAEIVSDLGESAISDIAAHITIEDGEPRLSSLPGFAAAGAVVLYGSPVIHELRYSTKDLRQVSALGDGLVYTGVMTGASFESRILGSRGEQVGLVRGKQAIRSTVQGGNATLAWQSAPDEVTYIGYSGDSIDAGAIAALRKLADAGRILTPEQWETKDRVPVAAQPG